MNTSCALRRAPDADRFAFQNPDAELDESERNPVPIEDARRRAEGAFQAVFEHGPKIELDHYLVYYSRESLGLASYSHADVGQILNTGDS